MHLSSHGIAVDLPPGWGGTIARRPRAGEAGAAAAGARPEEQVLPVAHLSTFPLPADRGDFGSGAVDVMGGGDVFVALVEYGPECAGTALFRSPRLPRPSVGDFSPRRLQRAIAGQAGFQGWCTVAGRAFCTYVVLGSVTRAADLVPATHALLASTRIEPR